MKLVTATRSVNGTAANSGREQKAAGIDAIYIYRLKYPPSPLIPSTVSLSRLSSLRIQFLFQLKPSGFLSAPGGGRNGKSEPSIPFDLAIVIFFQILPFSSKLHHPFGRQEKKEARSPVHPSARGFPYDCIREIAIYGCPGYCAAGYPLDIEGSERSSRENCPLRHEAANRQFPVCHSLLLLRAFVRAIRRYDKTRRR